MLHFYNKSSLRDSDEEVESGTTEKIGVSSVKSLSIKSFMTDAVII